MKLLIFRLTPSLAQVAVSALLALGLPGIAQAGFAFTIERLSDTQARITGSGAYDGTTTSLSLSLIGIVLASAGGESGTGTGTLQMNRVWDPSPGVSSLNPFTILAGDNKMIFSNIGTSTKFENNSLVSGTSIFTFTSTTLLPVGTTGGVFSQIQVGESWVIQAGNWQIVEAIPELDAASGTGALALLAGALALAGERRRRAAA